MIERAPHRAIRSVPRPRPEQAQKRVVDLLIAMSLCLSAGIHALVTRHHFQEWWLAGVFFVIAAVAQTACAFSVIRGGGRRTVLLGAILSLVLVITWLTSRTAGLPFGPEAGVPESAAPLDLAATATEMITLLAFASWLPRHRLRRDSVRAYASRLSTAFIVMVMSGIGLAGASLFPAGPREHGTGNGGTHRSLEANIDHRTSGAETHTHP